MLWWEYLDFISVEPNLYVKGKTRFVTKFGIVMSLLSILFLSGLSMYFIFMYIKSTDINVVFFTESKEFVAYMNLTRKPFFYRVLNITGEPVDPRIVKVTAQQWKYNAGNYSFKNLEEEKCILGKNIDEVYTDILKTVNLNSFNCFKTNNGLELTMDLSKSQANYINMFIGPCINSTQNNNYCYPPEKIKDILSKSNFNFEYTFPSYTLDHFNTSYPIKETISATVKKMYPNMFYTYLDMIKVVEYKSDDGIVFENLHTQTMFGRDHYSPVEIAPTAVVSVPGSFGVVRISFYQNSIDKYKRTFPKFQTVLANIGGVIKFIMFFTCIISKYVTGQMLDIELSNYFIGSEENKPSDHPSIHLNSFNKIENSMINLNRIIEQTRTNKSIINTNSNFRMINCCEALIPKCMLKSKSEKQNLDKIRTILRSKIGLDQILKLFENFDNLKYLILNENQSEFFDYMKFPTLHEHMARLNITSTKKSTIPLFMINSENVTDKKLVNKIIR